MEQSRSKYLIVTGGEPLVQAEELDVLVTNMLSEGYKIAIESNGTILPPYWWESVTWDIDCKCPSARASLDFVPNWYNIGPRNRIKFVVADKVDLAYTAEQLLKIRRRPEPVTVLVSPMIPKATEMDANWLQTVWRFCVDHNVRFSLQVHKVVFGNTRGV